jgi:hypothetical protein
MPERGDAVDVVEAVAMPGLDALVAERVADPHDGALAAAPKLKRLPHQPAPSFSQVAS